MLKSFDVKLEIKYQIIYMTIIPGCSYESTSQVIGLVFWNRLIYWRKSAKFSRLQSTIECAAVVASVAAWVRVLLHFVGSFMGKRFFILFDSFSKWIEGYPMLPIKTSSTLQYLCRFQIMRYTLYYWQIMVHLLQVMNLNYLQPKMELSTLLQQHTIHLLIDWQNEQRIFKPTMKKCDNIEVDISNAICRYLLSNHKTSLLYPQPKFYI